IVELPADSGFRVRKVAKNARFLAKCGNPKNVRGLLSKSFEIEFAQRSARFTTRLALWRRRTR
ncbi:MAG: hypothetical protein ACRDKE_00855, partial [Solirubrobacterales bacterium]